jgi:hypothetical protein
LICMLVPLHRLELCSSAPEADALSTELQGRAKRFYHIYFYVIASLLRCAKYSEGATPLNGRIQAFACGASCVSSARRLSMILLFPFSSPILASCSFLWASSPQTW